MFGESVIGFNSPSSFACFNQKVFIPTTNGVTVCSENGSSTFWRPTPSGLYPVDQLTISSAGCICLSESRLNVSLFFFDANTLKGIQEIADVASVGIIDMRFSQSGSVLFTLGSQNQSTFVKLFRTDSDRPRFSLYATILLSPDQYLGVLQMGALAHPDADFIVYTEDRIQCYTLSSSASGGSSPRFEKALDFFPHESGKGTIHCCAASKNLIWCSVRTSRSVTVYDTDVGQVVATLSLGEIDHGYVESILVVGEDVFLGTSHGQLYRTDSTASDVTLMGTFPCAGSPVFRLAILPFAGALPDEGERKPFSLSAGLADGIYSVNESAASWDPRCVKHRPSSEVLCVLSFGARNDDGFVAILKDCGFMSYTKDNGVRVWRNIVPEEDEEEENAEAEGEEEGEGEEEKKHGTMEAPLKAASTAILHAAMVDATHGIVALVMGCRGLFLFNVVTGELVDTFRAATFAPLYCECNEDGKMVCSDQESMFFFHYDGSRSTPLACYGFVHNYLASSLSLFRFLPNEDSFLAVCKNGEVFLLRFPDPCSADMEHAVESVMENVWRLDYPVFDLFPCYVEGSTINLFVHSIDKDTKLYALERQKDSDAKVLRPLFLMRDHECGGNVLRPYGPKTVFSGGRDGCLALRDIGNYQTRMSPIPPSKEKRKPLMECAVRHFTNGGITTACSVGPELIVCGGNDAVITLVPTTGLNQQKFSWKEPSWTITTVHGTDKKVGGVVTQHAGAGGGGVGGAAAHPGTAPAAAEWDAARASMQRRLDALREEWNATLAKMDDDVPVEALLLPDQRDRFTAECEEAIESMREDEFYHTLLNEYLQDLLKKSCYDSMEVNRMKAVSIKDKGLQVHNFHIAKASRGAQSLARKMCFMRKLQKKASVSFGFTGLRTKDEFRALPEVADDDSCADETKSFVAQLMDPLNVYTRCRGVAQALLLRGAILSLKDNFNLRFAELRARKESAVSNIKERTNRCVKIAKQLGGAPEEFFTMATDPEEDPSTLFSVKDEELDEAVRALIPPATESKVVSPSNEAALKYWMDGLEKDVERLEVDVPMPDFMDDTRDTYVPPDERTEEQVKRVEEYEKKLKDETEVMETRKEALRTEFKSLQAQNREAADNLDREFKTLRKLRLATQEYVSEAEMQIVGIFRHLLKVPRIREQIEEIRERKARLQCEATLLASAKEKQQAHVSRVRMSRCALESELDDYHNDVRQDAPFNDADVGDKLWKRFCKWKAKYVEQRGGPVPTADAPADDTSSDLWEAYCDHCRYVESLTQAVATTLREEEQEEAVLRAKESFLEALSDDVNAGTEEEAAVRAASLERLMDVEALYRVYQGQIQNERAVLHSDFSNASLRWSGDVTQRNDLITESSKEAVQLLEKTVSRQRSIKASQWEAERLQYCVGTLEMELRQLHTLKITRAMQEWLTGDAEVSEEKELRNIDNRMSYVNQNMQRKLQDLNGVAHRLKSQIAERETENGIIKAQSDQVHSAVEDAMTVKHMVDVHSADSLLKDTRAREIYVTSELEETARCQQEELIRLKREVDRLRERTFPSFAVVSKRTV